MKKQLKTLMYGAVLAMPFGAFAQAFSENMGNAPSTAAIATHDGASTGFQNSVAFAFTGTGDVRNTDASVTGVNGYATASGAANVFISNTPAGKSFQISGINTTGLTSPSLSFGIRKTTNTNDGSELVLEISDNGTTFTVLPYPVLPTGASGFAHWYYRTATGTIPSASNLTIRWRNTNTSGLTTQYRIDDVLLTGGTPVPTCTAGISVSGNLNCGNTATLTAVSSMTNAGNTYVWAPGGATTSAITTAAGGSYSVTITGTNGCVSSAQVGLSSTPVPTIVIDPSPASACGGSVSLCAHPVATDLIISEYSEGEAGFEKYIEIFNGTGAVATLTNYVYQAYHNGAGLGSPTFTVNLATFQPTLASGAVLVLRNSGSTVAIAGSYTTNAVDHNGNDALAIYNLSTASFADIFGTIGQNPGTAWTGTAPYSTVDRTLRRKSDVYAGVAVNPATGFPTLVNEWDVFFASDLSGFGAHALNATSYAWSNGGNSSCIAVTPTASGVYTVTGTFTATGCSATATVQVNVVPGISSSIDSDITNVTLCYGDQCGGMQVIVAGGTTPFTYSWSNGDNMQFTTVCPTVTTVYSVVVTDANGCTTTATTNVEVVNACCSGTNVLICNGTETLCVTPGEVPTYTNATVGPCVDGGRKIAPSASKSAIKNNTPVLNAYPNPFADVTAVEVKLTENSQVKVEIMDYTGKKVAELNNSALAAGTHTFNWNGNNQSGNSVASGLYLCRITSGENVQTIKIQKASK